MTDTNKCNECGSIELQRMLSNTFGRFEAIQQCSKCGNMQQYPPNTSEE